MAASALRSQLRICICRQACQTADSNKVGTDRVTRSPKRRCNYPGTKRQLHGCCNDAICMEYLLRHRFHYTDIRLLCDDGTHGAERPTRDRIIANIKWLVEDAHAGDGLFFHFSGAHVYVTL